MTKLCPRGKAAAKRKFKVYPSAYANAYASKICAGKIKDPSGVKRKDFRGPKKANIASSVKKTSALNEKYDAAVRARKKKIKSDKKKAFGAAATVAVGATGAHGVAKKKFPKYKEVMESNITIKDGKLKLKKKEK